MEEKKEVPFKPGEKGFAVFLLIFGAYFLYESLKIYQAAPGAASCGAVPLFVSSLIVIFSLAIILSDRKKTSENYGFSAKEKIIRALSYMFPGDVLKIMGMILLYCIVLFFGLGFEIATPIFLWVAMSYLMRKGYVKNILWTVLAMAFILIVFRFLFSVVLP